MKILIDIPEEDYKHLAYADHFKLRSYIESGEVIKGGKWIRSEAPGSIKWVCSKCGAEEGYHNNYCGNCGSRMMVKE